MWRRGLRILLCRFRCGRYRILPRYGFRDLVFLIFPCSSPFPLISIYVLTNTPLHSLLRRLPNSPLLHRPHRSRSQPIQPRYHSPLFPPHGRNRLHILHVRRQNPRTLQHQKCTSSRYVNDDGLTHPCRAPHNHLHKFLVARPTHLSSRRRGSHNRLLFLHDYIVELRTGQREESLRGNDQYRVSDWVRGRTGA